MPAQAASGASGYASGSNSGGGITLGSDWTPAILVGAVCAVLGFLAGYFLKKK